MAVATNVSCQAHPLIPNPASSLSHAACAQGGKMHSISCCDGCDFSPLSRTILSPGGKVVVAVVLPEAMGKGSVTRKHSGLGAGHQLDLRRSDGTAGFAAATTLLDAIITFSKASTYLPLTGDGTVAALEPMPTLVGVEDVDSDVTDYPSWTR
ncbi:hypothetical protein OsJ_14716 [Oryza sativa Japonica Group]|uniref:Uncharacterized protein n=1 Tax=Oryza sativa subsp. japonica TaxID=39947 RepID=A3ATM3_ORYSJ|nr:hypothetical protein OsJ_14716 [Oryza sativa Japonica Group]